MRHYDRILNYLVLVLTATGIVFIFSAYSIPKLVYYSVYNPQPVYYEKALAPFFKLAVAYLIGFGFYLAFLNSDTIEVFIGRRKRLRFLLKISKLRLGKFIDLLVWFTLLLMFIVVFEKFIFHLHVNRWLIGWKHTILITGLVITSYYLFLAYQFAKEKINWAKVSFFTILYLLLLIAQPDVGTSLLLSFSFISLAFFRFKNKLLDYFYYSIAPFVFLGGLFAIFNAKLNLQLPNIFGKSYLARIVVRINNWLNPFNDVTASSYQIANSLYAVHKGHLTGVGYGFGVRKLYMGATVHTDFIFATIGEETGFIFCTFIFVLTLLLLLRLLNIAYLFRSNFEKFFTLLVAIETFAMAFMNAGMAVNLLPSKGWPYPLISYAPFYLLFYIIQLGIIQYFVKRRFYEIF